VLIIENGTVYTPEQVIPDGAVFIDGRRIHAVAKRGDMAIPPKAQHLDAHRGAIVPGFVDMHIHGVNGHDLMDARIASLQAMAFSLPRYGVTAFVPTTVPAKLESIGQALKTVRKAMGNEMPGAEILGVHVEGPYLSAQERGAHSLDMLATPQADDFPIFLESADVIRSFTLAPELPGAVELIRALKERGILVSAGHSSAIDTDMERAVEAGLSHVTHMFCNMSTLRRANLRRVAGVVEFTLLDDRLTTEVIGDGYHISPTLMKLALKTKGPERLAVVTDANSLTGMPPGSYRVWGIDVILEESIIYVADRSAYAGSVATMDRCLRWLIESVGVSFHDALCMITKTPATILNLANRKGSLEAGMDADLVILDQNQNVAQTIVAGQVTFTRT